MDQMETCDVLLMLSMIGKLLLVLAMFRPQVVGPTVCNVLGVYYLQFLVGPPQALVIPSQGLRGPEAILRFCLLSTSNKQLEELKGSREDSDFAQATMVRPVWNPHAGWRCYWLTNPEP